MTHATNVIPLNGKSPELVMLEERMKLAATEYLIAFENNVHDIPDPTKIAYFFLDAVVEQIDERIENE